MHAQRGFILLELLMGAVILTLLAVWGANTLARRLDETSAQSAAVWMLSVRGATQEYLQAYGNSLLMQDPSAAMAASGYANWSTPTLNELKTDGLLSAGFPLSAAQVGGAAIRVLRHGSCPGAACRLAALITSTRPLVQDSTTQVDEYMLAQWLMAAQGWGGRVSSARPESISGSSFAYPNPPTVNAPVLPPGTVALAITAEQYDKTDFLRVADSRDPDFQGKLTVQGNMATSSDISVGGYLRLNKAQSWLARCDQPNALAPDNNGGLLLCTDGQWQFSSRGGGGYSIDSKLGCRKNLDGQGVNPMTNECSCPPGSLPVLISDSGPGASGASRVAGYLCVNK